jgi:NADPH-dependent 2,4-dienoyl-CoA reductase/sulfur reductase-like enzyme
MGVGRLKRAADAEAALASGAIDLAAFGRASIADPDLPRKVRDGREARVLACLGCIVCLGRTARPETICPVNPTVGREAGFDPVPLAHPLRLAIRGSSLSALAAAWVAARRGHQVTLYEPAAVLGGLQGLRARVPGQEEIAETVAALLRRAEEAGVTLVRGEPGAGNGDLLWGVRRFVPVGAGPSGGRAARISSYDVLASADGIAPESLAVVIGDDLASADAALILAARGVVVELRSPAYDIAVDAHPGYRELVRRKLERLGAAVITGADAEPPPDSAGDTHVVRGRDPRLTSDDDAAWEIPRTPCATRGWLDDAYEPGRMTKTVYDAVAHAMRLDGS